MQHMVGKTKSLWELTEPTLNDANLKLEVIEKKLEPWLMFLYGHWPFWTYDHDF